MSKVGADVPEHAQGFIYVLDATGKTKQGWPLQMGEIQAQASTCNPPLCQSVAMKRTPKRVMQLYSERHVQMIVNHDYLSRQACVGTLVAPELEWLRAS